MASTGTVTIAATVNGLPTGAKSFSLAYGPIVGAVAEILDVQLASGNNTVTVPAGATWMLIAPPSANTVQLKLLGTGTDSGFALDLTRATLLPLPTGTTSVILNAAGNVTPEISFV